MYGKGTICFPNSNGKEKILLFFVGGEREQGEFAVHKDNNANGWYGYGSGLQTVCAPVIGQSAWTNSKWHMNRSGWEGCSTGNSDAVLHICCRFLLKSIINAHLNTLNRFIQPQHKRIGSSEQHNVYLCNHFNFRSLLHKTKGWGKNVWRNVSKMLDYYPRRLTMWGARVIRIYLFICVFVSGTWEALFRSLKESVLKRQRLPCIEQSHERPATHLNINHWKW